MTDKKFDAPGMGEGMYALQKAAADISKDLMFVSGLMYGLAGFTPMFLDFRGKCLQAGDRCKEAADLELGAGQVARADLVIMHKKLVALAGSALLLDEIPVSEFVSSTKIREIFAQCRRRITFHLQGNPPQAFLSAPPPGFEEDYRFWHMPPA